MKNLIELDQVSVRLGRHTILKDLRFSFESNRLYALVGPNAAGKTTFLELLAGFHRPSKGTIRCESSVGFMASPPVLYPELTVEECIRHAALCQGHAKPKREAFEQALARCHLQQFKDCLVSTLSSGYQQRLGIAQAIVCEPTVILLDEPTAALDPEQRHYILHCMRQLCHHQTVIFSTHLLEEALQVADEVLILQNGQLGPRSFNGFPQALGQIYWARFLHPPTQEQLAAIPGVMNVQSIGQHFQLLTEASITVLDRLYAAALKGQWGLLEIRPLASSFSNMLWSTTCSGSYQGSSDSLA